MLSHIRDPCGPSLTAAPHSELNAAEVRTIRKPGALASAGSARRFATASYWTYRTAPCGLFSTGGGSIQAR